MRQVRAATSGIAAVVAAAALVGGCEYPRDPDGTLDRVKGGTMRVGIAENEPWTSLEGGEPSGVEVTLVERFADQLGAEIDWVEGTEEELIAALKEQELDLVIAPVRELNGSAPPDTAAASADDERAG